MRSLNWKNKEMAGKDFRVFKGYPVKMKKKEESVEQHYVVPWELTHEECKTNSLNHRYQ